MIDTGYIAIPRLTHIYSCTYIVVYTTIIVQFFHPSIKIGIYTRRPAYQCSETCTIFVSPLPFQLFMAYNKAKHMQTV